MKRKSSFDQAAETAGQLYGNLLGRLADKAGYEFIVDQLDTGKSSVRDIVKKMLTSEEFREKFVMNNTPNELAKALRVALLEETRPEPESIKSTAIQLLETDWREVVIAMIDSKAYERNFGEHKVPVIRFA